MQFAVRSVETSPTGESPDSPIPPPPGGGVTLRPVCGWVAGPKKCAVYLPILSQVACLLGFSHFVCSRVGGAVRARVGWPLVGGRPAPGEPSVARRPGHRGAVASTTRPSSLDATGGFGGYGLNVRYDGRDVQYSGGGLCCGLVGVSLCPWRRWRPVCGVVRYRTAVVRKWTGVVRERTI